MSDNRITIVMLKITSADKYNDKAQYPYAVKINDNDSTGLTKESWVLTDKELLVNGNNKLYLMGHLSEQDLKIFKTIHNIAVINNSVSKLSYD